MWLTSAVCCVLPAALGAAVALLTYGVVPVGQLCALDLGVRRSRLVESIDPLGQFMRVDTEVMHPFIWRRATLGAVMPYLIDTFLPQFFFVKIFL